jgi:hypothetical protein
VSGVLFAAGDHIVRVRGDAGRYTLHVTATGAAPIEAGGAPPPIDAPVTAVDEVEPNGDRATAMPIALDSSRGGVTDFKNDIDMYRFTLLGRTPVHLTVESAAGATQEIKLGWGSDDRQVERVSLPAGAQAPMTWDGTLAAGDYYVTIWSGVPTSTPYRVRLRVGDPFASGNAAHALDASAVLQLDTSRVAAAARDAQTIAGHLDLTSKSDALDLTLTTFVADERWTVTTDRPTVHLAPGGRVSVPVTVHVAPDAWDNHPVHIAVGARNASGAHVTATAVVVPDSTVAAVNPTAAPALPAALAGGLNVAWSALGGESLDNHPLLIDGLSNDGGTQRMNLADAKNGVAIHARGARRAAGVRASNAGRRARRQARARRRAGSPRDLVRARRIRGHRRPGVIAARLHRPRHLSDPSGRPRRDDGSVRQHAGDVRRRVAVLADGVLAGLAQRTALVGRRLSRRSRRARRSPRLALPAESGRVQRSALGGRVRQRRQPQWAVDDARHVGDRAARRQRAVPSGGPAARAVPPVRCRAGQERLQR